MAWGFIYLHFFRNFFRRFFSRSKLIYCWILIYNVTSRFLTQRVGPNRFFSIYFPSSGCIFERNSFILVRIFGFIFQPELLVFIRLLIDEVMTYCYLCLRGSQLDYVWRVNRKCTERASGKQILFLNDFALSLGLKNKACENRLRENFETVLKTW